MECGSTLGRLRDNERKEVASLKMTLTTIKSSIYMNFKYFKCTSFVLMERYRRNNTFHGLLLETSLRDIFLSKSVSN